MENILTDGLPWAYKHCNALKFDKLNFDGLAGKCQKMSLSNFCTIQYVEECQCTSSHKGTTLGPLHIDLLAVTKEHQLLVMSSLR